MEMDSERRSAARRWLEGIGGSGLTGRICAQLLGLLLVGSFLGTPVATALMFQVDFASSTYQVQAGDTYADLLAQFQSETIITSNTLNGLEGISAPVYANGVNRDYSLLMTTTVEVLQGGQYTFQVGTDWGRGGASVVIDNGAGLIIDEFVTTDDIWWNNDWNNSDVFTTTVDMSLGASYTLGWIGFEGCCGGPATVRFSFEGGAFQSLDSGNADPFIMTVPEAGTGLLVALGLALMPRQRRRLR